MSIKYAYIHPYSREYLYADTREELQAKLAEFAAQVYVEHYCNGTVYTIVEVQEDGLEKWYAPTGEQIMTPAEMAAEIKHMKSFADAGQIPLSILGG